MLAFLALVGVVAAFVAGWAVARFGAGPRELTDVPPVTPPRPVDDEPRYVDVLDQHATGVVVMDAGGKIEYRNPAALEFAGTHVAVLVDAAAERHLGVAATGTSSDETLDLFGPPRRVVHVAARPLANGRAVAFLSDITERRRVDQVRTDFVANVSHELRTPVGALSVLAETLRDADRPDDVDRIVRRMQLETDRAARVIDDLLELSRVEAAGSQDFAPVALSDVVAEAVARVTELAGQRGITISTLDPVDEAGPRSASIVVDGDRRHLVAAIGNLVENAVKYSDDGAAVQIRVRSDGTVGEIMVADSGAGIPRHDLDRVFERFYRVDRARSRGTGGTGLGLSIVRHVAQLHGGSVALESVEGEGTTFSFRIPLAPVDAPDPPSDRHEGSGVA